MRHLQLLLFGTVLFVLALVAFGEPIHSHHHNHHLLHHKKKHNHHHHHHKGVYGFGDPFASNGRWLPEEDATCNCGLLMQKIKRLREKVMTVLNKFDKLLKVQVDLRQIKNLLKNIDLSLTTLGGFLASSESQLDVLGEQTWLISVAFSRAKAGAVQLITKENLVDYLGSVKSSTESPTLEELEEITYPSCQDKRIVKTGVYKISVNVTKSMYVLCSLDFGNNAWTVIQNRFDGTENFFRPWNHYKQGFGYYGYGEYWLGLENIHSMMAGREHELLILLEDFDGKFAYAKYKYFRVDSEKDGYKLSKLHHYVGTAGNSLQDSEGMMFSTYDRDNDKSDENCAERNHGAWWYKACGDTNLNGAYRKEYSHDQSGLFWKEFRGVNYSLKRTRIMIRSRKDHHHHHHHRQQGWDPHKGYHRLEGEYDAADEFVEDETIDDDDDFVPTSFEKAQ
ncbi:AGAP002005-PA-like protein [Anopheles sinensis]|uniref:AGAP002005-PA-like protein n=1 Tax=Anopheles sinensis TaxID=74873 RepID=A0A084VHF6_ANOSI|nr:AGAP002005-PA-like protein [Anopheles sinensis]